MPKTAPHSSCLGSPALLLALASTTLVVQTTRAAVPIVPVPPENPITESKRVLGKALFFDEQMSTSNVVSCATCHVSNVGGTDPRLATNPGINLVTGGGDDIVGSPGIIQSDTGNNFVRDALYGLRPQVTGRSANSPINAAFASSVFWDGRALGRFVDPETGTVAIASGGALESQSVAPPLNTTEMAHSGMDWPAIAAKLAEVRPLALAKDVPSDVATALAGRVNYPELFRRAFGDSAITARRIAFAIATFERTLISDQAPFDLFQAGNTTALTPNQINGMNALRASNCTVCHVDTQGLFTGGGFRNVGLRPDAEDNGLAIVTGNRGGAPGTPNDLGKFKVPSLRNVGLKRTFMHNGQFTNLADVIRFYARAPGAAPQFRPPVANQDPVMATVNVPPQAAGVIQDFIQNGLLDPRVRDRQFPFDSATLFSTRTADQAVILGGAVAGSGATNPALIAQSPALIGSQDFRVGLDAPVAHVGKTARLGLSTTPPSAGRITATTLLSQVTITGDLTGGVATGHITLSPNQYAAGQTIYAQWFIDDAAAPGGEARSDVARYTLFCGPFGCPSKCLGDFDGSQTIDVSDIFQFLQAWFNGQAMGDVDASRSNTVTDIFQFLRSWFQGC